MDARRSGRYGDRYFFGLTYVFCFASGGNHLPEILLFSFLFFLVPEGYGWLTKLGRPIPKVHMTYSFVEKYAVLPGGEQMIFGEMPSDEERVKLIVV
jgi:hypothetical protein